MCWEELKKKTGKITDTIFENEMSDYVHVLLSVCISTFSTNTNSNSITTYV